MRNYRKITVPDSTPDPDPTPLVDTDRVVSRMPGMFLCFAWSAADHNLSAFKFDQYVTDRPTLHSTLCQTKNSFSKELVMHI